MVVVHISEEIYFHSFPTGNIHLKIPWIDQFILETHIRSKHSNDLVNVRIILPMENSLKKMLMKRN